MKSICLRGSILSLCVFALIATPAAAIDETMDGIGKALGGIGDAVGGTVEAVGKTIGDSAESLVDPKSAPEARQEIDQKAKQGLDRLLRESAPARILHGKSYGYAVFDSRKFSFMLATGFGAGVAVEPTIGKRTYMKMATGGVNFGAGAQFFQLVFLFENKRSFDNFVMNGWEAGASASAVFGKDALETNVKFVEGMAMFQLNSTGVMADLNITGTRYYKSKDLNANM